ncbi:MAG TPA: hypothetical protein VIH22_07215 [Cyclobacteriaceae bacterium]
MYTDRIAFNLLKGVVLLLLFITLSLYSLLSRAQTTVSPEAKTDTILEETYSGTKFRGASVSFLMRAFTLKSNIAALDGLIVVQEGGQAGFFFGNRELRGRFGLLGFLYSSMRVPRTINVFECEGALNYYPLNATGKRYTVEPYLVGGLVFDNIRFRGHYLTNGEGRRNTSIPEPYLGAIRKLDATLGAGIEIGLVNAWQFVHLFSEMKYGAKLFQTASNRVFENTTVSDQLLVSVGFRFGSLR